VSWTRPIPYCQKILHTKREREREKEREGGRDVAECGLRQARFVIDDARKIRENPSSSAPRFPNA